jgi:hypothetical protein
MSAGSGVQVYYVWWVGANWHWCALWQRQKSSLPQTASLGYLAVSAGTHIVVVTGLHHHARVCCLRCLLLTDAVAAAQLLGCMLLCCNDTRSGEMNAADQGEYRTSSTRVQAEPDCTLCCLRKHASAAFAKTSLIWVAGQASCSTVWLVTCQTGF